MTFEEIKNEYGSLIMKAVRTRLGQSPDVDDVVSDIYLALYLSIPKFRGESKFNTFVFSIVHRRMADYWRRKLREPKSTGLNENITGACDEDIFAEVDPPIRKLTPAERRVFALLGLGMSNTEIADQACLSVQTVRSHLKNIYKLFGTNNRAKIALLANHFNHLKDGLNNGKHQPLQASYGNASKNRPGKGERDSPGRGPAIPPALQT